MDREPAPSTIVVQAAQSKKTRADGSAGTDYVQFDVGRSALQVMTAVQSAPLWEADLKMVATTTVAAATTITIVGAYTVAIDNPAAWPVPSSQPVAFVLAFGWLLAARWRSQRILETMTFASVSAFIMMLTLFAWWIASFESIKNSAPVAWWLLMAALSIEALCSLNACIAVASLLSCRLSCDAHACTRTALVRRTESQLRRGDLGNGVTEARMTAGALALHDAAMVGKPSAKKNE